MPHYLYFCTSKASKVESKALQYLRTARRRRRACRIIYTFVLGKQVKWKVKHCNTCALPVGCAEHAALFVPFY
jgi:hypothetical protein